MEFSGTTGIVSLFDLAQLLSLNGASGMLRVESGKAKRYLYFHGGRIINAMDEDRAEGEEAAKRAFALREANFHFTTDLPSVPRRIEISTQNLMMEIARQLDEEEARKGESEGERLRDARRATEELNRLFLQLDTEVRSHGESAPGGFRLRELLEPIRQARGATLYLREEGRPEVRAGARRIPLSDTPLERAGYEKLRRRLLGREQLAQAAAQREEHHAELHPGERYRIEIFRAGASEVLAISRLWEAEALCGQLPWPPEKLEEMLRPPGSVVLVTAPEAGALEEAFQAACAHLAPWTPGPFLGLARRWAPGIGAGRSALLLLARARAEEAERALRLVERMNPALVAIGEAGSPEPLRCALEAMRGGSRSLLGVCVRRPELAARQLPEALPSPERRCLARHLAENLAGILAAPSAPGAAGSAWGRNEIPGSVPGAFPLSSPRAPR